METTIMLDEKAKKELSKVVGGGMKKEVLRFEYDKTPFEYLPDAPYCIKSLVTEEESSIINKAFKKAIFVEFKMIAIYTDASLEEAQITKQNIINDILTDDSLTEEEKQQQIKEIEEEFAEMATKERVLFSTGMQPIITFNPFKSVSFTTTFYINKVFGYLYEPLSGYVNSEGTFGLWTKTKKDFDFINDNLFKHLVQKDLEKSLFEFTIYSGE